MEQLKAVRPAVEAADKALEALVSEEQCLQLVEAIVTKYLALSPQELEEWQVRANSHAVLCTPATKQPYGGQRMEGAGVALSLIYLLLNIAYCPTSHVALFFRKWSKNRESGPAHRADPDLDKE